VDNTPTSLDGIIANYYRQAPEEARLEQVYFQLERSRTQELIERLAPAPPATVFEVASIRPTGNDYPSLGFDEFMLAFEERLRTEDE
jgi:hypothetical protein